MRQLWSDARLSAPARPAQCWVGQPSLEHGQASVGGPRECAGVRTGGPPGGGDYTSPASPPPPQWHHEARSRISPVPALTSRQRRRILSHAIWRARRSPAHCGGRGRGQRGRCPPWSQEEAAGPPPPASLALEVGQGAGEGGWQVLSGSAHPSIRTAGAGALWAVPSAPPACSLNATPARSSGLWGSPLLPFPHI